MWTQDNMNGNGFQKFDKKNNYLMGQCQFKEITQAKAMFDATEGI